MKSILVVLLCVSLSVAPVAVAAPLSPAPPQQPQTSARPLGDVSFEQTGSKSGVETLRGDAAQRHFANWRSKNPKAYGAAVAAFARRGWQPTEHVVVMRTLRLTSQGWVPSNAAPFRQVQDFSGAEGEVMFWSADDGNPATWEGTVYCDNYQDGNTVEFTDQVDISTDDSDVMSEDVIYEHFGDRGGEILPVASRAPGLERSSPGAYHRVLDDRNRAYLKCVLGGVGIGAIRCAFSGPLWAECALMGATIAVLGCLIMRI